MGQNELIDYLVKKRILTSSSVEVIALSGGVSCEILLIKEGDNKFVLKRALARLKVKDDWYADVNRNKIEQKYIKYVADFLPSAVPKILYSDDEHHFFCMEMLDNGLTNWKDLLLNKQINLEYADTAGKNLGIIHNKSNGDPIAEKDFDTLVNFNELRIEPYLIKTGKLHPDLSSYFYDEAMQLASTKKCLVHGDFSPKNILIGPKRFVLLDSEVAWYGDPLFDIAFFLNHFFLKSLYIPGKANEFMELARVALKSYMSNSGNVIDESFEYRLVRLLLLLMLARVDGKSPVEYLNTKQQQIVRDFVYQQLRNGRFDFDVLITHWIETISNY
ncbi:aminoglycoside phosphotransferase family protein [Chitinophagaceae bacterium LB-8]|uniref:Aminoglycoside phosphotransferase family protein n=1 Tax=Paraflavisolibacter caeni TaxID=2982496 RepID=A0A9X3B9M6_9BACT|nr:aminoglycoside phosphotransferase family protein [Paraflavisolibacter caeni]MCU7551511.1 aminoglycoside phosphotransferase family protein [Paraflavisolibacter caeni]